MFFYDQEALLRELRKGKWHGLAAAVMAALAVRVSLLGLVLARSGVRALNRPDTASYLGPGRNLLLYGRFMQAGLPEIGRTPGYALFLALASLAGPVAAALAQIALSALSVVLVWRLARAVLGEGRIALTAAWLFAFEPLSILYSILLLSETLFLALYLLSLERLAEFLRGRRLGVLATAGTALAAATFVRPVTYYLPFALALGLFLALARIPRFPPQRHGPVAGDPGLRWKAPAVLLLSVLPWLAAWQIRNHVESGFSGFSSIQVQNLYFFNAAEVIGRLEHRPLAEVQNRLGYNDDELFLARHPAASNWNQAERLEFMRAEAGRVLRAHPGLFLRLHLAGALRTALNPGAAVFIALFDAPADERGFEREREQGPLRAALWTVGTHPWQTALMATLELVLLALYVLAALGVAKNVTKGGAALWLLLGVSFYFFGVSGGRPAQRVSGCLSCQWFAPWRRQAVFPVKAFAAGLSIRPPK